MSFSIPAGDSATQVSPVELRTALGAFATGVTIITTRGPDGGMAGVTVNSFNSVSLDPPLVLWSLASKSYSLPLFTAATHWGVHILSADQHWLSDRFARPGAHKFEGLDWSSGLGGTPCSTAARPRCNAGPVSGSSPATI